MGAQPLGLAKSEQDIAERQPQLVVTVLASTTGIFICFIIPAAA
jgi:hypothetical protein